MNSILHLQTFIEVASAGSFAAAARLLSLPRSTVTARIKALERKLGIALFQRTTRLVRLTPEGEAYLNRIKPALDEVAAAADDLKASQAPAGTIRISIPIDLSPNRMADLLAGFQKTYPEVSFDVDIGDRPVDLIKERFDLALRGKRVVAAGLIIRKISENPIILVARAEAAGSFKLDASRHYDRILDPIGVAAEVLANNYVSPPLQCRNLELTKAYILRRDWAAFLPRALCQPELDTGVLLEIEIANSPAPLPLYAVLPSGRFVPRRVRLFLDYLAERIN